MKSQHHRWAIHSARQHPYTHSLTEFPYTNPALPSVTNVDGALNYIVAVLYPNAKAAVATVGDLPAVGNTINDYRVVTDDGDGKAAAYRWEQREGDVAAKWYKVMDVDWSSDSILAQMLDITLPIYVSKMGITDIDDTGADIVGTYAGQTIYGGDSANQNLTLRANSGDGTGASTGYVQVDDNFRPAVNNTFTLGTASEKFTNGYFAGSLFADTLTLTGGSITDSSGAISFGDENLSTTGNIDGGAITGTTLTADDTVDQLTLSPGLITDTTGAISFGNENLSTTGTIAGATGSTFGTLTLADGSITDSGGAISFGDENLSTSGTLGAGVTTVTQLNSDNLRLDGNTLSSTDVNGNIILSANGSGVVDIQSPLQTLGQTVTGTVGITGQLNADNLRLDGNVLSATDLNGSITLTPNGSGVVVLSSTVRSSGDNSSDLGAVANRFQTLYLGTSIHDGTDSFLMSELIDLRSANWRDASRTSAVQVGDALFWSGSQWLASAPDTEVDHGTISGIADDDHTQYLLLAGRAGGQSAIGGTDAGDDLTLESTSNVTKGNVFTKDTFSPFTNASYAAGWSGTDLGDSSHYFKDLYTKGELIGARMENYTSGTLPSASGQNVGRFVFATDVLKAYVDTGGSWKVLGVSKYLSDTTWNGTDTTKDVTVSSDISDARNAIWALHDNANDYDRIYCSLKAISATQVRITVSPALPAGSYRLIGIE